MHYYCACLLIQCIQKNGNKVYMTILYRRDKYWRPCITNIPDIFWIVDDMKKRFACVRKDRILMLKGLYWWNKVTNVITDEDKVCGKVLFERFMTNWVCGHQLFLRLLWVKSYVVEIHKSTGDFGTIPYAPHISGQDRYQPTIDDNSYQQLQVVNIVRSSTEDPPTDSQFMVIPSTACLLTQNKR